MANETEKQTLYIVLRADLNLSVGKIASQSSQATDLALAMAAESRPARLAAYRADPLRRKVALRAKNEAALLRAFEEAKAAGLPCGLQVDLGLTEVDPNTPTALGIGPVTPDELPNYLRRLQAL